MIKKFILIKNFTFDWNNLYEKIFFWSNIKFLKQIYFFWKFYNNSIFFIDFFFSILNSKRKIKYMTFGKIFLILSFFKNENFQIEFFFFNFLKKKYFFIEVYTLIDYFLLGFNKFFKFLEVKYFKKNYFYKFKKFLVIFTEKIFFKFFLIYIIIFVTWIIIFRLVDVNLLNLQKIFILKIIKKFKKKYFFFNYCFIKKNIIISIFKVNKINLKYSPIKHSFNLFFKTEYTFFFFFKLSLIFLLNKLFLENATIDSNSKFKKLKKSKLIFFSNFFFLKNFKKKIFFFYCLISEIKFIMKNAKKFNFYFLFLIYKSFKHEKISASLDIQKKKNNLFQLKKKNLFFFQILYKLPDQNQIYSKNSKNFFLKNFFKMNLKMKFSYLIFFIFLINPLGIKKKKFFVSEKKILMFLLQNFILFKKKINIFFFTSSFFFKYYLKSIEKTFKNEQAKKKFTEFGYKICTKLIQNQFLNFFLNFYKVYYIFLKKISDSFSQQIFFDKFYNSLFFFHKFGFFFLEFQEFFFYVHSINFFFLIEKRILLTKIKRILFNVKLSKMKFLRFFFSLKKGFFFPMNLFKNKLYFHDAFYDILNLKNTHFFFFLENIGKKKIYYYHFLPITILRCLRIFSRFFFFDSLSKKRLYWCLFSMKFLIEFSGINCKKKNLFFICCDFNHLFYFLCLSRNSVAIKLEIDSLLKKKIFKVKNKNSIFKELKIFKFFISETFDFILFLALEKVFHPKKKITNFFLEETNYDNHIKLDGIFLDSLKIENDYLSKSIILKILKIKKKTNFCKLILSVRNFLYIFFISDPRDIKFKTENILNKSDFFYPKEQKY
jgi:hypothetical protein